MTRPCLRGAVVLTLFAVPALLALTPPSATAQSQWKVSWPTVLGMAENGLLVTAAPPAFAGCNESETWGWYENMFPNVALWSYFGVLDPEAPAWTILWLSTPPGAYNFSLTSDARLRVFRLQGNDLDWYLDDPCAFYAQHEYIADGLGRVNMHCTDDILEGPGVSSWGWVVQGDLQDNGYCPAGRNPRLFWLQEWTNQSTDLSDYKTKAAKGPTLTCK